MKVMFDTLQVVVCLRIRLMCNSKFCSMRVSTLERDNSSPVYSYIVLHHRTIRTEQSV